MTNKVSFSRQHSSLENIEGYYADSENSLNNYFNSSSAGTLFPIRFFGYNTNQIDNELKQGWTI
jgi:hypothetical protein